MDNKNMLQCSAAWRSAVLVDNKGVCGTGVVLRIRQRSLQDSQASGLDINGF